jgi:ERCC4-type nuclease
MEPRVSIIADDREASAGVVQHLRARPDCEVVIRRLRLADYHVAGRLMIERKSWPDLIASIADGPLHSAILLEGGEEDIAGCAMSRDAIQGALISVSVILGIPVLRSRSAEESARIMLYASRQLRSVISGAVSRPGYRPKSKRRIQLHVLQGLPSVGPTRAARLLDRYGSVEAVLTAGLEDLALVSGVGKSTAHKIRWAVSEPGVDAGKLPAVLFRRPNESESTDAP